MHKEVWHHRRKMRIRTTPVKSSFIFRPASLSLILQLYAVGLRVTSVIFEKTRQLADNGKNNFICWSYTHTFKPVALCNPISKNNLYKMNDWLLRKIPSGRENDSHILGQLTSNYFFRLNVHI